MRMESVVYLSLANIASQTFKCYGNMDGIRTAARFEIIYHTPMMLTSSSLHKQSRIVRKWNCS